MTSINQLTVVVANRLIVVNNEPRTISPNFTFPAKLHAIQFEAGQGHSEWSHQNNTAIQKTDLLPYVQAWEAAAPDHTPTADTLSTQERTNLDARTYLYETDWYVVRFLETGKAVPPEISTQRQQARDAIVDTDPSGDTAS
jgi:hypothetical protein